MPILFDENEIFDIAIQIEKNGARFYKEAVEYDGIGDDVKKKLLELAAMEEGHERLFTSVKKSLKDHSLDNVVFDPYDEASMYLGALADGHVFVGNMVPSEVIRSKNSMEDILEMALLFEKDSILFYTGMLTLLSSKLDQDRICKVVKEEMRHITCISKELIRIRGNRAR